MPAGPLIQDQLADLAESIRRLLRAIESGEMTASAGMVHRLEGALTALKTVGTGAPPEPTAR